jgi:hypothetical protein
MQQTVLLRNLNSELAEKFTFTRKGRSLSKDQQKLAFSHANSEFVFQEAQLHSVPFIYLFYGDKSFSLQHRGSQIKSI